MESVLLRTTVAMLVAWAGGAVGVALGKVAARRLTVLVGVAAGALLLVTLWDVLPDAKADLSWPVFALAVGSGAGLFWLVGRLIHPVCPACSASAVEDAARSRLQKDAVLLMAALAIHSTVDGLAVAAGDGPTGQVNLPLAVAVSLHKLPEGMALALLLVASGYRRPVALGWTWAVEATTLLGGLLGVWTLRDVSPFWLSVVFAHVGGGFLYLVGLTASAFTGHAKIPPSLLDTSPNKTL